MKSTVILCLVAVVSCKSVQLAPSSDCPETDSVNTFNVPDPDDCSKYSVCGAYVAVKVDCPEGEHFSKTTKKCQDVVTANCDPEAVAAALAAKAEADAKAKAEADAKAKAEADAKAKAEADAKAKAEADAKAKAEADAKAKVEADAKVAPDEPTAVAAAVEAKPAPKADEHTPETKPAEKPASALVGKPKSQPGAPGAAGDDTAVGGPPPGVGGQPSSGPGAKPDLKLSSNPAEKPEGLPEQKVGKP
ncbi:tol-Pal system protein TolA-like [Ornithodoros turicata]|uniref:tol-Pal system protein TolA-like n=1 Tax=Ornithodoros turicata TaxID=34597 RepID=UPI003139EF9C